jgi:hypothetical protein
MTTNKTQEMILGLGFRVSTDVVTMTEDDLEFWVLEPAMTCHNDPRQDTGYDLGFRVQR